jgi:hypothetical protein
VRGAVREKMHVIGKEFLAYKAITVNRKKIELKKKNNYVPVFTDSVLSAFPVTVR